MFLQSLIHIFFSGSKRTKAVKTNIIGSLFVKGISILIQLLLVPMTLGYVNSEMYGIWLTLSSIIIWLNFFDIGFTLGLKNKLAEAIATQNWERGKSLVSTTYIMMLAIFVPLCFILEIVVPCINWAAFLNVSTQYNTEITRVMYALVAFFCCQMIVGVIPAVAAAYQKVALSSSFTVIGNCLSLAAIFLLTKYCPPSLLSLAFAISMMPIVVMIVASIILFTTKFRAVAPSIKAFKKEHIHSLFSLGFKFFLLQLQVVILYQSTNILISNVSSSLDVTSYNIAYKYLSIAEMIFIIVLGPLWPAFTDAYTKKDYTWMNNVYKKMILLFMGITLLMICLTIISPIVYHIWVGNKVSVSFSLTLAVGVYLLLLSWCSLQTYSLNGMGTIKLQTYVATAGLIIHIPLALYLGRTFGVLGVIYSLIIIHILYTIIYTLQLRKILTQRAKGIWLK